jgi:hypothetical protein
VIAAPLRARRILWLAFLGLSAVTAGLAIDHVVSVRRADADTFSAARTHASRAARAIDDSFRDARKLADAIVQDLSSGALAYKDVEARMRRDAGARGDVDGIAVTFQPFVHTAGQRLYQEYVFRTPEGTLDILRGATYDYTRPPSENGPKTAWYHGPLEKGPLWNEPFLATGARKVLIEYGAPFRAAGDPGRIAGVVTVDFSLEGLQEMITRLDLGETGYGMVFTTQGAFLAHPDRTQLVQGSVFKDPAFDDARLREAITRVREGATDGVEYVDPVTGSDVWVLFEPIAATGWSLALVIQRETADIRDDRRLIAIALCAAGALVALVGLLVRLENGATPALWIVSTAFSAACTACIVLAWMLAWDMPLALGTAVASRTSVERYLERHRAGLTRAETCHEVRTGVQITAIKFPDAASVTLGGYVWQTWPDKVPKEVERGFVLPQVLEGDSVVEEQQRVRRGTEETIVWRIVVTLQQSFNPRLFPFDRRNIALQMLPKELAANVVLVPDLDAYPVMAPRALPGISKDVRLSQWMFRKSFFSYRLLAPTSTVGVPGMSSRTTIPVLHFNLATRRHYLGPFIAYLLPAMLAALLTFAFLMTREDDEGSDDLVSGLSYVAALFFTIVISHSALRDTIAAVGITYLEHIFILLYVVLGLVVMDAFWVARRRDSWLVKFRNHLPSKLLYWPLFSGALLVSTLAMFIGA